MSKLLSFVAFLFDPTHFAACLNGDAWELTDRR